MIRAKFGIRQYEKRLALIEKNVDNQLHTK